MMGWWLRFLINKGKQKGDEKRFKEEGIDFWKTYITFYKLYNNHRIQEKRKELVGAHCGKKMIFCPKKFEFSLCQNWELRYLNGFFVVDQKGSVVTVCCIWDRLAEIHSSGKITFEGAQAVENGIVIG